LFLTENPAHWPPHPQALREAGRCTPEEKNPSGAATAKESQYCVFANRGEQASRESGEIEQNVLVCVSV
jgi:hypothetical protein